jgi:2-phospho-L-lactate guanylyltransferase (CobY/MobA/RfbA family)
LPYRHKDRPGINCVHVVVDDSSQGGTADITVETVLVRIPHGGDSPPRHATVTTEDDVTYSTTE